MSLLDTGNQDVIIYPEVTGADSYGNPMKVPSATGYPVKARVQPFSNIASAEDSSMGQMLNTRYRVRIDRNSTVPYGPWSECEWNGQRFEFIGEPERHSGSDRTKHLTAFIRLQ